jgi:DNA end-binding protein Ku
MIEVHEFVKTAQIDPLLLDRVYYLEPDLQGGGYKALVKALKDRDLAGICTWTMRKRSYLGALQASGKLLRLNTLRHADELVPAQSLELRDVAVSDKELKIGTALIDQLTASFEPRKFENEHQRKLQEMIEKKARGEKIAVIPPRRLEPTESDKLLQALEASLKKAA